MHCLRMTSVEKTDSEAGLGVVGEGMKGSMSVSIRYYPRTGYEAASWACQSWTVIYCHMLGMSLQDSFVVIVFHRAT